MHFLTHASHSTVNAYIQILFCETILQKKIIQNIPSERGNNLSHKIPAGSKLRMYFSGHSLNRAF
jgi:hypothetical protein